MVDRYEFLSKFCSFFGHCELKLIEKHRYKGMRSAKSNFTNNIFTSSATSMKPNHYIIHWRNSATTQNCPVGVNTMTSKNITTTSDINGI